MKATWVKVEGVWKKVKNVWLNIDGVWKQRITPKGNINGLWKEFIQYLFTLYDYGVENVPIVRGYTSTTTNSFQKNADNIELYKTSGGHAITFVTSIPIDVSNYSKLYVEWEKTGEGTTGTPLSTIGLSTNKSDSSYDLVYFSKENFFSKEIVSLDISSLEGEVYIKGRNSVKFSGGTVSRLYFYKIWLE